MDLKSEEWCKQECQRLLDTGDYRRYMTESCTGVSKKMKAYQVGEEVSVPSASRKVRTTYRWFVIWTWRVPGSGYYMLQRNDGRVQNFPKIERVVARALPESVRAWNNGTIEIMVREIQRHRTYDAAEMAILADALEEAGYTNMDVLNKLRNLELARKAFIYTGVPGFFYETFFSPVTKLP